MSHKVSEVLQTNLIKTNREIIDQVMLTLHEIKALKLPIKPVILNDLDTIDRNHVSYEKYSKIRQSVYESEEVQKYFDDCWKVRIENKSNLDWLHSILKWEECTSFEKDKINQKIRELNG